MKNDAPFYSYIFDQNLYSSAQTWLFMFFKFCFSKQSFTLLFCEDSKQYLTIVASILLSIITFSNYKLISILTVVHLIKQNSRNVEPSNKTISPQTCSR